MSWIQIGAQWNFGVILITIYFYFDMKRVLVNILLEFTLKLIIKFEVCRWPCPIYGSFNLKLHRDILTSLSWPIGLLKQFIITIGMNSNVAGRGRKLLFLDDLPFMCFFLSNLNYYVTTSKGTCFTAIFSAGKIWTLIFTFVCGHFPAHARTHIYKYFYKHQNYKNMFGYIFLKPYIDSYKWKLWTSLTLKDAYFLI